MAMGRHLVALALGLALVLAGLARPAAADEPLGMQRLTVDRVEATPAVLPGMVRLRVFVSAIDLATAGSVIPIEGKTAFELQGAALKRVPYLLGLYEGVDDAQLAIVFVVMTSGDYGDDVEVLTAAIRDEVLPALPAASQVGVIGYGDDVVAGKLVDVKKAADQLDNLVADPTPSTSPALLRALDRALRLLKRAKPVTEGGSPDHIRKVIVVVSDGRDAEEDPNRVTRLGKQADKQGVRIHAIAYSPADERRPLFALGELSKQSQGTFRWIQKRVDASSLRTPFKKLVEELRRQYVVTLFVPEAEVPRKVAVAAALGERTVTSADAKVPTPTCGEAECSRGQYCANSRCVSRRTEEGRGIFGWILLIGGIAVGALASLVAVGFVITKVRERREAGPRPPGPPAKPVPGLAVVPAAAASTAPAAAAHVAGPCLLVLSGPMQGQRVPLHHGFQIGKAPDCHLSLAHDGFASGHHAQILMDAAGNCSIVDQGSTNGTYINGVRITDSRLFDGMAIRCGSTELRFLQA